MEASIKFMITKKIIIPNRFTKSSLKAIDLRFFHPRAIVIQVGQSIQFINEDQCHHYLESVNLKEKPDHFFETGEIKSGQSVSIRFKNFRKMIPFKCKRHPVERGVIFMLDKEEKDMTDTERLRLLTRTADTEEEFWNLIKRTNKRAL
jgi:hypothetical protein